jgi:hypothetical protein
MNHRRARRALTIAAVLTAIPLMAGCPSSSSPSASKPASGSKPSMECLPNIDCPPAGAGAASPPGSSHGSPAFSSAPIRWGDWKFGECAISLWPAYVGLTLQSSGHLVILASTACVGYQPTEIHTHITLQRWWKPGGATKSDWHDTGVTLADNTPPPLVRLPPEGEPPLSEQHKISGSVLCTPNNLSKAVPYRLRIDLVGVSYNGDPIVTGGYGSAYIVSNWDCL